jgi:hypothetical protein
MIDKTKFSNNSLLNIISCEISFDYGAVADYYMIYKTKLRICKNLIDYGVAGEYYE